MDLFQIPDDYKPEKPLTEQEMDEITNYLTTHPLFMKQVPQNISDNPHLQALQNIIYDQDPDVVAESLNKQGNQRLKINPNHIFYMKQAYRKYTEGIKLKCNNAETNAKLHSNRAMINLKLKNYRKVIEDCKSAIKFSADYTKAYYRYASALIAIKDFQGAINLLKSRSQNELKVLEKEAVNLLNKSNQQKEQKQNLIDDNVTELSAYCKGRGWRMKKRSQVLPGNIRAKIVDGKMLIPTIILYPQFSQFDLIEKVTEERVLREAVSEVVQNLPWDSQKLYNPDSIELLVEVADRTYLKLKPIVTVKQLLRVYEFPEAIEVTVVCPKSSFYPFFLKDNKIVQ